MRGMTGEQRDVLTQDTRDTVAAMLEELRSPAVEPDRGD